MEEKNLKPLDAEPKTNINVKISKGGIFAFGFMAFFVRGILPIILLLAVASGSIVGVYQLMKWKQRRAAAQYEQNKQETQQNNGKLEIQNQQIKEANQNAHNANIQSKNAAETYNRRARRDSSTYDSNFSAVNRKFCSQPEFANDTGCK